MHTKTLFRGLAAASALFLASAAHAELITRIKVDTSSLVGSPSGPFSLDFQLNDGSALGDGNNTATLSNFQFGGGSAFGTATTSGGASSSLGTNISLSDTDALLNEFYQAFLPGSWLSFDLNLTTNSDAGDTPDIFSFALLDGNLWNLPTQALGSDNLVEINIDGSSPSVATFASADGRIQVSTAKVPEAAPTAGLCGIGFLALLLSRRRFGRRER